MAATWIEDDPEGFEAQKQAVAQRQPYLDWDTDDEFVCLGGLFLVRNPASGKPLDGYDLKIRFPESYPRRLPRVWETGGQLPDHHLERHVSRREGCCLFVAEEFYLRHPDGFTVLQYLEGPVNNYFLAQLHYEHLGEWPWPDRSHELAGIEEAYEDLLGVSGQDAILGCVDLLRRRELKGRWDCPCGSGRKLRDCHLDKFRELQEAIPEDVFQDTFHRLHGRPMSINGWAATQ